MGVATSIAGSKTKSSQSSKSESWLLDELKPLITSSISGVSSIPELKMAGLTDQQIQALEQYSTGDYTKPALESAAFLQGAGLESMLTGRGMLEEAQNNYYKTMELYTGENYRNLVDSYYNSDLVNQQIGIAERKVNEQVASGVQGLNQQATASGNMGSSRAGVGEGVLRAKGAEALGDTVAGIQSNMYNTALSSAATQASQALGYAANNQYAGIGQSMVNQGMNLFNIGANTQYGIASTNVQNQLAAGEYLQGQEQQQLDLAYQNYLTQNNQALAKLQMLLPVIGGTAGWETTTKGDAVARNFNWGHSATFDVGSLANMGSDARLKDNIVTIEEALDVEFEGVVITFPRIVEWEWNDAAKELFEELPPTRGVIAQELIENGMGHLVHIVETSHEAFDGFYYIVNYAGLIALAKEVGLIKNEEASDE